MDKSKVYDVCLNCGEIGHLKRESLNPKDWGGKFHNSKGSSSSDSMNSSLQEEDGDVLVLSLESTK